MYPLKFIVLIQVLPWLVFTCEIQTSEADKSQRTLLRDYFQKSLINDSEKLLTLQQAFLTPRQKYQNGLYLYVYVTVEGRITDTKYSYRYLIDDHCSRYLSQNNLCVYQTSMKFELIPPDQDISVKTFLTEDQISMVLEVLDPSFHLLARLFQILDTAYYGYYGTLIYDLEIMVDNVEIMLNDLQTDVRNALYLTLSWAKAYAKSDGNQILNFTSLEDISWLMEIVEPDNHSDFQYDNLPSSSVAALIFCTFFWLNILILIFTVLNMDKIYSWLEEQRENLKDLYKASASVLTFTNLAAFGCDLTIIHNYYYTSGHITYLIIKLLLVVLIIIIDLVVSCLSTSKHNKKKLHGIMHALALCQIIWFVHRLATDAIISVIAFVIAPVQTLGAVTLLLSTVVCAILFVLSMVKKSCRYRCSSKEILPLICTLLIAICTIGLIVTVTLLFIALVSHGLHSAGIGGFILSLVPPTAIFVIGLCVNRKIVANFYHSVFASNSALNTEAVSHAADAPTNVTIKSQVNETTPLTKHPSK